MKAQRHGIRRRQIARSALSGLGVVLAGISSAIGCGLLFGPAVIEQFTRAGHGTGFRLVVGISHLAGGVALLIPRIAEEAALVLGSLIASAVVFLHGEGDRTLMVGPALLAFVLLAFGVCLRIRHRLDRSAWQAMLGRYAAQADAGRSEPA